MQVLWHHTKEASRHVGKHTVRFFFPYVWHYLTDDYEDKLHHLVVDTIFALIMIGLVFSNLILGYRLYESFIPAQMSVQISVDHEAVSGADLPITVRYHNLSKDVENVQLTLYSPQGFSSDTPTQTNFETLPAGTFGTVEYDGYFIGGVNQSNRFIVSYSYEANGQEYLGLAVANTHTVGSTFEVVPNTPDTLLNNQEVSWTVEYRNSSHKPRKGTCITIDLPESFALASSSRELDETGTTCFKKIKSHTQGAIEIAGVFSNAIGEGRHVIPVTATDAVEVESAEEPIRYTQAAAETTVRVLTPRISLATTGAQIVNVGEAVRYTNSYTNTGDAPLRDVVITTQLDGVVERASVVSVLNGSRSGNTITWVDPLVLPGETHTRSFDVVINPALREKNATMSYTSSATAQIDNLEVRTFTPTSSNAARFNSTLNFVTLSRYYLPTGEQIGYGPYPMRANDTTGVRVFWEIRDFTNDMSNVRIQTTLPSQVEWTGLSSVTAGSGLSYDPATRTVTWQTSSVPSFSHAQGAQFEVRVKPNFLQEGQHINITNGTTFSAFDSHTGTVFTRSQGPLRSTHPIEPEVRAIGDLVN